jgi:biopolymer transport protein ExbD
VDVNLPQANVRPLSAIEDYAIVSIRPDGTVLLEETELTLDQFEASFPQFVEGAGTKHLLIRADRAALVEPTVRVIVAGQQLGLATSFIVEPEPQPRPR